MTIDLVSDTEARITTTSPLAIVPDDGCRLELVAGTRSIQRLRCAAGVRGVTLHVAGLGADDRRVDLVLVRVRGARALEGSSDAREEEGSIVTPDSPSFTIPAAASSSRGAVVLRYVRLGCEHVLSGLDHVLFMIALFWQAVQASRDDRRRPTRRLLSELSRTATAFTLAHSLTLAATVLGWIAFPASVAEACIAASLVLVALDVGEARANPRGQRVALAFAFGLVHGLGFAGALSTPSGRLPEHAIALGLLSFNVGVELGQALVFAAGVAALALVPELLPRPRAGLEASASSEKARRSLSTLSAYVVGTSGVAMFLARLGALLDR